MKWHPDKNVGNEEEATIRFKEISTAYAVLGDAQEKKWYDDHRESILRYANCFIEYNFPPNFTIAFSVEMM